MCDTLAVVPIFVNAGTALLPAIVAPLASVLALLLRPKQLVATLRRKPGALLMTAVGAYVVWWGIGWAMAPPEKATAHVTDQIDWVKVAEDLIQQEKNGPVVSPVTPTKVGNSTHSTFRNGNARCGYDGGPVPVELVPSWRYQPEDTLFLSSPVVVGDRVFGATFTLDPIALDPATAKCGAVVCLDANTGKPIWTLDKVDGKPLKPIFSSPAITDDGQYLIIGQGLHDDRDSDLICINAETGRLHWRVKTPLHVESSPAILGDMVVVGVGAIVGKEGYALAVKISDGTELWRHPVIDAEGSPAISPDGTVYIGSGFEGNAVYALRSQTDAELKKQGLDRVIWKVDTPYPMANAATLADDLVIVGGGNGDYVVGDPHPAGVVLALDAKTGKERWKTPLPDAVLGAVAVHDGKAVCAVRNGEVVTLSVADGKVVWKERVSGTNPLLAAPAVAGKHVYAVSKDGYLAVIELGDGKLVKKYPINDTSKAASMGLCLSSPTIARGCVYVGSETGGLRCFSGGKVEQ